MLFTFKNIIHILFTFKNKYVLLFAEELLFALHKKVLMRLILIFHYHFITLTIDN